MSKIICLCAFQNAFSYIQDFMIHLTPYVDNFLFFDDRSYDDPEAKALIACYSNTKTLTVFQRYAQDTMSVFKYEVQNRQILLREAVAEGATHVLCLDADERMERPFLEAIRSECSSSAVWANVRDLWDTPQQYRVGGVWSMKNKPVLFPTAMVRDSFMAKPGALHTTWLGHALRPSSVPCRWNLYHLGSLTADLRKDRVARHQTADPKHQWQDNYSYLADENGLQLERIPEGRHWY